MNRVDRLLGTPDVSLWRFDHPPDLEHSDPECEVSPFDAISFVEAGSFEVRIERRTLHFEPGSLFVTSRGLEFSCAHAEDVPTDRCLTVAFDERAVEDLLSADVPRLGPPTAVPSPRDEFLLARLRRCGPSDQIRLELLAGSLYQSIAGRGGPASTAPKPRKSGRGAPVGVGDELGRRVDRAIERIEADYGDLLCLRDLASTAGLSPFHFARVFRDTTGLPPHRYLTAVRLRHAADRLRQGAAVTETCFDVGFGSLSHFITAFRARFGVLPSSAARGARVPTVLASVRGPSSS